MAFKADEIASVIQQEIEQYSSKLDVREVGRVLEVGDGIARVYGLSGVMAGEMVEFPGGKTGGYTRFINKKSVQGGWNVILVPQIGKRYVLLRHFRHETRDWHWEFPRGFGEPGLSPDENAAKELREELGVDAVDLVELGRKTEGAGGTIVYLAKMNVTEIQVDVDMEEGISEKILVTLPQIETMITNGELSDLFSLWAYTLMKFHNIPPQT